MPSPRALFFHPFRAGLWPCGTVYLPGHMGCYAHPAYLPAPGGARPLWGGGVSVSNGNKIPSPSVSPGAALLDLEQTTLPGIAHLVVETMIVSDQIRPEDRASVLRTLLLKHRCQAGAPGRGGWPSDSAVFREHRLSRVAVSSLLEYLKRQRAHSFTH